MAVPARPTSGAPIESAWGDIVHDAIVAMDIQSGKAAATLPNAVLITNVAVTFPRPFAAPPIVVASVADAGTSSVNFNAGVTGITATGCTLGVREVRETVTSQALSIGWIAYGPRA